MPRGARYVSAATKAVKNAKKGAQTASITVPGKLKGLSRESIAEILSTKSQMNVIYQLPKQKKAKAASLMLHKIRDKMANTS